MPDYMGVAQLYSHSLVFEIRLFILLLHTKLHKLSSPLNHFFSNSDLYCGMRSYTENVFDITPHN
jgi:hypothetical protein